MKQLIIAIVLLFASIANAADIVKMSRSGICHTTHSRYYERTQNYTPYATLQECLQAGGREPKRASDRPPR